MRSFSVPMPLSFFTRFHRAKRAELEEKLSALQAENTAMSDQLETDQLQMKYVGKLRASFVVPLWRGQG